MRPFLGSFRALFLCLALLAPAPARADQRTAAAELAYAEGKALMDQGRHAEACAKLEQSLALEEAMGARFLLAECYGEVGKVASAWTNYVAVAEAAEREGNAERAGFARERADEVRARVPTVTVQLAAPLRALSPQVLHDGKTLKAALIGAAIPVDPGTHRFEVRAAGHEPFTKTIEVPAGAGAFTVEVPALVPAAGGTVERGSTPPPPEPAPDDGGGIGGLAIAGFVIGGAGIAAMAAGIGVGAAAKSSYDEALAAHCDGARCDAAGVAATEDARAQGVLGTAVFGAGAGVAAVGVVLAIVGLASGDQAEGGAPVAFIVAPRLDASSGMLVLEGVMR
jgi:hypothetical protein